MRAFLVAFCLIGAVLAAAPAKTAPVKVAPPATSVAPKAPSFPSSFHGTYAIFGFRGKLWSRLINGEVWQAGDGNNVQIKTLTNPTLIGKVITPRMVQVWNKNKGWTKKWPRIMGLPTCIADKKNSQLTIPGDILTNSANKPTFKGYEDTAAFEPKGLPKVKCAKWEATLPNGEGRVVYFVKPDGIPLISNYFLKGAPPVWVQYGSIEPVQWDAKKILADESGCPSSQ